MFDGFHEAFLIEPLWNRNTISFLHEPGDRYLLIEPVWNGNVEDIDALYFYGKLF